jgi:hypothetical protein
MHKPVILTVVRFLDYNPDMTTTAAVREQVAALPNQTAIRVADLRRKLGFANDAAIEQAFSRLAKGGVLTRISKGVYWKAARGRFGMPPPPTVEAALAVTAERAPGPAGPTAAAFLGLTTQIPPVHEFAVIGKASAKLRNVVFHERTNAKRADLTPAEIAVLEIARDRCRFCEVSKHEVITRLAHMASTGKIDLERVLAAANGEGRRVQEFVASLAQGV